MSASRMDEAWERRMGAYIDDKVDALREQNALKMDTWKRELDAGMKRRVREIRAEAFIESADHLERQAERTIPEMAGALIVAASFLRELAKIELELRA